MSVNVSMTVNGKTLSAEVEERTLLVQLLRENFRLTGTHVGCDTSQCGACVVHVDGKSIKACNLLAVQADGHDLLTVEGIAPNDEDLHPLQQAFQDNHGLQCGYCTPGMLTTLVEFLKDNPSPNEREVREAISGNLCRCTGYQGIVAAALDAVDRLRDNPEGWKMGAES